MSTFTIKNTAVSQSLCLNNQQEIIKVAGKIVLIHQASMNMRNLLFYKITQGEMFIFSFLFLFFAGKYAYSNVGYGKIVGCPKVQDMLRKYRNLDVD